MFRFFNIEKYKQWTITFPFHFCPSVIQIFFGWPLLFLGVFFQICTLHIYLAVLFFSPLPQNMALHVFLYCAFFTYISVRLVNLYMYIKNILIFSSGCFYFNHLHQDILLVHIFTITNNPSVCICNFDWFCQIALVEFCHLMLLLTVYENSCFSIASKRGVILMLVNPS